MINVVLYQKGNNIHAFELSGHANSGPYGYDLVCAGVSAVTFGAVNALIELSEADPFIQQEDDGGYLYVELPDSSDNEGDIQTILKAMVVSLETIERDYASYIHITRK
ncbi:MAG TPA: ribosomal-processing cysteine protease Prp [Pseudogracilibacillus sp.]|nr:ribosomal-processing cysteine protease Prp [Pseudogracilibacillus sp.]